MKTVRMQTALGKVRGLGSAKTGTEEWFKERLTALGLVPLTVWFVASLISGIGDDYETLKTWMSVPGHMAMMILVVFITYWHGALALVVIVEDYVHNKTVEIASLIAIRFGAFIWGVVAVVAILKLGLGG